VSIWCPFLWGDKEKGREELETLEVLKMNY